MQSSAGAGTNNGSEQYYREEVISIAAQDRQCVKKLRKQKKRSKKLYSKLRCWYKLTQIDSTFAFGMSVLRIEKT